MCGLISTVKKQKNVKVGNELLNILPKSSHVRKSHHQILAKCHVGLVEERNQEYPCMLSGLTGVPQLEYRAVRNTIVLQAFNEC